MEKVIIFLMGIIICFIAYKWYLAVKRNKELVQKYEPGTGGGVNENKETNDSQTT
jgi:hypothetical protein